MCRFVVLLFCVCLDNGICQGIPNYLPDVPPSEYPVLHAALPRGVAVYPLPLGADHELAFNVTWDPPVGPPVRGYSIEVHSITDTTDCHSNLCYEYNLPGNTVWSLIPTSVSPVPDGCAVRPGCAYQVRLIAHPWDGHTVANVNVELDECVLGVCSCAHAPRLPRPRVSAELVSIRGELLVNVSWSLPPPSEPLRLPPRLKKHYYYVSIGKQMVSDAHPAPWYAHTVSRKVNTFGFVSVPEDVRWLLLPISERSTERKQSGENNIVRSGKKSDKQSIVLDVKLLARVNLIDERGCVGPPGNATAYDPTKTASTPFKTFVIWTVVCSACVMTTLVLVIFSARAVKRVLRALRPSADPLQPLCVRPAWFQFAGSLRKKWNISALAQGSVYKLMVSTEYRHTNLVRSVQRIWYAPYQIRACVGQSGEHLKKAKSTPEEGEEFAAVRIGSGTERTKFVRV